MLIFHLRIVLMFVCVCVGCSLFSHVTLIYMVFEYIVLFAVF